MTWLGLLRPRDLGPLRALVEENDRRIQDLDAQLDAVGLTLRRLESAYEARCARAGLVAERLAALLPDLVSGRTDAAAAAVLLDELLVELRRI